MYCWCTGGAFLADQTGGEKTIAGGLCGGIAIGKRCYTVWTLQYMGIGMWVLTSGGIRRGAIGSLAVARG